MTPLGLLFLVYAKSNIIRLLFF